VPYTYRAKASSGPTKIDDLRDLASWAVAVALFLVGNVILIWYGLP
jgi:hypothetical protein